MSNDRWQELKKQRNKLQKRIREINDLRHNLMAQKRPFYQNRSLNIKMGRLGKEREILYIKLDKVYNEIREYKKSKGYIIKS